MTRVCAPASTEATVTVLCQNEARHLDACLASIARAGEGMRLAVSVIVNGSRDGSAAVAARAARTHGLAARIYTIAYGDKANAINQAIHGLLVPASLHIFADAYAVIAAGAFRALADTLASDPHAMAATGLAGNGRTLRATAATTLQGGRLNGQLHAFRPAFLDRMVAGGIRLPVGLYRGDGLLTSMVCHNLDAAGQAWDSRRCAAARAGIYFIPQLSPFRPRDIARQFRRKIRQMRGVLENQAIKDIIHSGGYAALPAFADDMIAGWLAAGHRPRTPFADRPFMAMALRQHARARRPDPASLSPVPEP